MPQFSIVPGDGSRPAAVMSVPDEASVFRAVHHLPTRQADVLRDGAYAFSVRLADNGLWCIFQRPGNAGEDILLVG
jgi:hypothetical protein